MDSRKSSGNETRVGRTALVVALALTASWNSSAMASTQPMTDCTDTDRFESLIVSAESPALQPVDHIPAHDTSEPQSSNFDQASRETVTSLLDIEPSASDPIESMLDDNETARETDTPLDIPSAPVADSDHLPDWSEPSDAGVPTGVEDGESVMPMLERQMYRIDI